MLEILRKMAIRIALFPVRPSKVLARVGMPRIEIQRHVRPFNGSVEAPLVPIGDGDLKMYRSRLRAALECPQLTLKPLFESA